MHSSLISHANGFSIASVSPTDPISSLVFAAQGGHDAIFEMLSTASFAKFKGYNSDKKLFKEYSRPIFSMPFLRPKKRLRGEASEEAEDDSNSIEISDSLTQTETTAMKEAIKNSSEMALKILDRCLSVPDKTETNGGFQSLRR